MCARYRYKSLEYFGFLGVVEFKIGYFTTYFRILESLGKYGAHCL